MNDYKQVADALKNGADPARLCETCPWGRHCIEPPTMTSEEVEAGKQDAMREDEEKARERQMRGEDPGVPIGMLLSTVMLSGRDTSAQVCPVFALRLKSSDGENIVKGLKVRMQSEVTA